MEAIRCLNETDLLPSNNNLVDGNISCDTESTNIKNIFNNKHVLLDHWTLWAHLPHDTDWSVASYKKIFTFNSMEEAIALCETLPDKMIKNCMLFLMREGIHPTWEDVKNRNGGCFSYKISNKNILNAWKQLSYTLVGETVTSNVNLMSDINGITISPKKNFCIIKIWIQNCIWQNPKLINDFDAITSHGCRFKRHIA